MRTLLTKDAIKKYGYTILVQRSSLDILDGGLFMILGPRGCGKITLLRMITGFNSIAGDQCFFS